MSDSNTNTVPDVDLDFSLPNVGPGPDPFSLVTGASEYDFIVIFFQRDYYCTRCRSQVQALADRIDAFHERGAEVISILPEPVKKVQEWQERYELPYPLLADADASTGDRFDQPVRFGFIGERSDFLGRMPAVVIIDRQGSTPTIAYSYRGSSTFDRPDIDAILEELDSLRHPSNAES